MFEGQGIAPALREISVSLMNTIRMHKEGGSALFLYFFKKVIVIIAFSAAVCYTGYNKTPGGVYD